VRRFAATGQNYAAVGMAVPQSNSVPSLQIVQDDGKLAGDVSFLQSDPTRQLFAPGFNREHRLVQTNTNRERL
jgi:hypothetical protein